MYRSVCTAVHLAQADENKAVTCVLKSSRSSTASNEESISPPFLFSAYEFAIRSSSTFRIALRISRKELIRAWMKISRVFIHHSRFCFKTGYACSTNDRRLPVWPLRISGDPPSVNRCTLVLRNLWKTIFRLSVTHNERTAATSRQTAKESSIQTPSTIDSNSSTLSRPLHGVPSSP